MESTDGRLDEKNKGHQLLTKMGENIYHLDREVCIYDKVGIYRLEW